ncbi:MAG: Mitochondrial dicarboxylate transporter [Trizodia sp. TS-e1964]|nr:MAG: Mitochondrial dicarboxylate transporter [Trizodia sp. TS-e1964]
MERLLQFITPYDLVKVCVISSAALLAISTHRIVRLQIAPNGSKKGMTGTFAHIVKTNGLGGLYSGISASLLRQLSYSTIRFGVYEHLKERHHKTHQAPPSLPTLVIMGCASGLLGGIAGNPADVINVRMQQDAALPPGQHRNYKHALDGLARMTREEGARSLFRGVWPNSARAVLMTASQLASYDSFKGCLISFTSLGDSVSTHLLASLGAGFVATTICSPFDVLKTRVMSASGRIGLGQLVMSVWRSEGAGWMFRGWVPSFVRLGPHTIATFLFLEQHKRLLRLWRERE